MLRQANDHLERTMNEKQELEDSVKQANEETAAKVHYMLKLIFFLKKTFVFFKIEEINNSHFKF